MSCNCTRCQVLRRLLIHREDPSAPLPGEAALARADDDWPWWLLGGLVALLGVLLLPDVALATVLLIAGGLLACLPFARDRVLDCERVRSS